MPEISEAEEEARRTDAAKRDAERKNTAILQNIANSAQPSKEVRGMGMPCACCI
jgi:hypothetical protein